MHKGSSTFSLEASTQRCGNVGRNSCPRPGKQTWHVLQQLRTSFLQLLPLCEPAKMLPCCSQHCFHFLNAITTPCLASTLL
jgi:hypothetical protein